jgi:hypothetical protein
MGQRDKWGEHDQYDWIDACVVEVGGKSCKLPVLFIHIETKRLTLPSYIG